MGHRKEPEEKQRNKTKDKKGLKMAGLCNMALGRKRLAQQHMHLYPIEKMKKRSGQIATRPF